MMALSRPDAKTSVQHRPAVNIETISQRVRDHEATEFTPGQHTRQAAVALILQDLGASSRMLFIERAKRAGDPWSGHMAFPGGHREPDDVSLAAAAERETLEEIGLDLSPAAYLGPLDQQRAQPRGSVKRDLLIAPHVWILDGKQPPPLTLNYEVADVVWAEVPALASNVHHDTEVLPIDNRPTVFNGYRLPSGHFIWGLTYRMLKSFFLTVDPAWQPPAEVD